MVDYLISEVKVSTEVFNTPGNTPIMRAAANGHTETMKLLISKALNLFSPSRSFASQSYFLPIRVPHWIIMTNMETTH